jgi:hypothetical protein
MTGRSEQTRRLYGSIPRFENDQKFLPLQAADFWAWWVREWCEAGNVKEEMEKLNFGKWGGRTQATKHMLIHISFDENQLARELQSATSLMFPGRPIYDVTYSPFPDWPAKSS